MYTRILWFITHIDFVLRLGYKFRIAVIIQHGIRNNMEKLVIKFVFTDTEGFLKMYFRSNVIRKTRTSIKSTYRNIYCAKMRKLLVNFTHCFIFLMRQHALKQWVFIIKFVLCFLFLRGKFTVCSLLYTYYYIKCLLRGNNPAIL